MPKYTITYPVAGNVFYGDLNEIVVEKDDESDEEE